MQNTPLSTNQNPGYLIKVFLCCIFNYQAVVATLSPIFTAWLFKPYSCKINNKTEKNITTFWGTFPNAKQTILLIDKIDISNTRTCSNKDSCAVVGSVGDADLTPGD